MKAPIFRRGCTVCSYTWNAPSDKGNCPKCHSSQTTAAEAVEPAGPPPDMKYDGSQMRAMITRLCKLCGLHWLAPSEKGKCPACRGDQVENKEFRFNALARV